MAKLAKHIVVAKISWPPALKSSCFDHRVESVYEGSEPELDRVNIRRAHARIDMRGSSPFRRRRSRLTSRCGIIQLFGLWRPAPRAFIESPVDVRGDQVCKSSSSVVACHSVQTRSPPASRLVLHDLVSYDANGNFEALSSTLKRARCTCRSK